MESTIDTLIPDCLIFFNEILPNLRGSAAIQLSPFECCQNQLVFQCQDKSITRITLDSTGLNGNLPIEISKLANLTTLSLNGNGLKNNIPNTITLLTRLRTLGLSNNSFTGSLPTGLSNLKQLNELLLSNNNLTGEIPSEIGSLSFLTLLSLSNNSLSGSLPSSLGSLIRLNTLYLENNTFTGILPTTLGDLISLRKSNMQQNQFVGSIPSKFYQLMIKYGRENYKFDDYLYNSIPTTTSLPPFDLNSTDTTVISIIISTLVVIIAIVIGLYYFKVSKKSVEDRSVSVEQQQQTSGISEFATAPSTTSLEPELIMIENQQGIVVDQDPDIYRNVSDATTVALDNGGPIYFFYDIQSNNLITNLIKSLYLNDHTLVEATFGHESNNDQEINIIEGDQIFIEQHTMDGWCQGRNITKNQTGKFPIKCITPKHYVKIHLISCYRQTIPIYEELSLITYIQQHFPSFITTQTLNLNEFEYNDGILNSIFTNLKGNERSFVHGTTYFETFLISYLNQFGEGVWNPLSVTNI
ncbi:hypothetical protein BC833DRAFT_588890 [Globomyces pollinis-pini]|nr:hypothetical protein BC833DRAFT_588890 [Globomyces pollinis-pini]